MSTENIVTRAVSFAKSDYRSVGCIYSCVETKLISTAAPEPEVTTAKALVAMAK